MNKLQTLKGFRDFLPNDARARTWLRNKITEVVEKWGYEPLETPTLEPFELFAGQIGEDEKLFYSFKDQGGRKVALRYDQTVPTCRVIGEYGQKLVYPFRRYQVQPAYRAEKPQKGRYREFTQFDFDIFGVASPFADAEVIAVTLDVYKKLGFKDVVAIVSNRDLMKDIPYAAIASIDKLKKLSDQGVINEMLKKGIGQTTAKKYLDFVKNLKPDTVIETIFSYLAAYGISKDSYKFEPTLARSFSYSQGPIWEIVIPEYSAGSVAGGERYDRLVESVSGQKIPGTGIAIGFDRTLEAAQEQCLVPSAKSITTILVSVFNKDLWNQSVALSRKLRDAGIATELYPEPEINLEKQLKYADRKGIPFVIIAGPEEIKKDVVTLKNMVKKTQVELPLSAVIAKLTKDS